MLENVFLYSVLKYYHSRVIGEELNVGVLFIFPNEKQVHFKYPHNLTRLKKAYPSIPFKFIKSYLSSFESHAYRVSRGIDSYFDDYSNLLSEHFLVEDGSALQFTKLQEAVKVGTLSDVIKYYFDLYLSNYNVEQHKERKNNIYLYERWKKLVLDKKPVLKNYLPIDDLTIKKDKVLFRPDTHWKNGKTNLVKGITFDLEEEEHIVEKALLWQNKFQYIAPQLSKIEARVDLLISEPSTDKYKEAYTFALGLLDQSINGLGIYTESTLDTYVNKILKEVHTLSDEGEVQ